MLRAGAKNYPYVSVIVDPADYKPILEEMKKSGGSVSKETNFRLAKKVYALTARYDKMITDYLAKK
ncbi:MAG: transformylase/IMP cyclohydrolase PurH [Deltaproteobacteria bacterium]|nr:transformylase/IMP cyclohydrolase PurH [Deltaproteobacteria bacterium]